ncbi:MAG: acylneuraminate cytidylyltransferase family protein [Paludibacteraceae bacterium]|nr:acylneuraminate cytidylyltransferase family protein [Paludibacteraceae bacterium]
MKVVALMPIKMNNERLPGKNTKLLGGKPLLQYQLDNLLQVPQIDEVNVYCSNEEIVNYLPKGVQFEKRPKELDLPTANFSQIFDAFSSSHPADIYVFDHATAPFVSVETIQECINAVLSGDYDSAFCATKIQDFLWQDGQPLNFDATNIPRSQDIKPIYRETSGVYVFTRQVWEKLHRRIGGNPYIKELSFKEAIDINNPEDFRMAEIMLTQNN